MSDAPKSIWRRPWQGRAKIFGWWAILAGAVSVVILCVGLASAKDNQPVELALTALAAAVGIATLVTAGFWFVRWLCCWRNFRRFLVALAGVATLIAIFYAEENWRGQRAWTKYKHNWEAKGEKFDLASIAPPSVPDDQNFAAQPIWVEEISGMMGMEKARTWYGDRVDALGHTNPIRSLEMPLELSGKSLGFTNREGNWQVAEMTDLESRQGYYRRMAASSNAFPVAAAPQTPAADVLLALSKYDAAIEKLRTAGQMPYARFPVGYADDDPASILLPHLSSLKGCTLALRLRAVAELQAGQPEAALADVRLMLRLTEALRAEPFVISHLVRIALLNLTLQPIWEGLADHKWSAAQLIILDAELEKLDFLKDYYTTTRGESVFGSGFIDYLRRNRSQIENVPWSFDDDVVRSDNGDFQMLALRVAPDGWFEQNKLSTCRMVDDFFLPIINLETRVFSSPNEAKAHDAIGVLRTERNPYRWFTRLLLPALKNTPRKSVYSQAATDLARIALALERYRLAHGQYPETLDALRPQFIAKIPHDVMNGRSLHYRRTDDGSFVLYSVGWNETDDGGTVAFTEDGKTADPKNGDWVWTYPAK